jgi:GT2 family glycosyltransferase
MTKNIYRFERPENLEILRTTKLSVAVVIACRGGQEKLDLTLASIAAQSYPSKLINVYVIDDGSVPPLKLPAIKPAKTRIIRFENNGTEWGKTKAINSSTKKLKEDALWFVDADMVFDSDHLAHHMKWHHDSDDYVVLGWKRFVKQWSYSPAELKRALDQDKFMELHEEHWGKELWEARSERTNDLRNPGVEGFRNFVGATFSILNRRWKELGGYNPELVTGEDTELGWRIQQMGFRTVADRQAHSWHLGFSTIEENKEELSRHNNPLLSQLIPELKSIRSNSQSKYLVSTYEVVLDVRNVSLSRVRTLKNDLLEVNGTQADFVMLGNWDDLKLRYSPTNDQYAELREIYNWLKGDSLYRFIHIDNDQNLKIEQIIELFTVSSTPIHVFAEAEFELSIKDLVAYLRSTEWGLIGLANDQDRRAFALTTPALARAKRTKGDDYLNISEQFGVNWLTYEKFLQIYDGKNSTLSRAFRFMKREGKKINSPKQLALFLNKVMKLILRKIVK